MDAVMPLVLLSLSSLHLSEARRHPDGAQGSSMDEAQELLCTAWPIERAPVPPVPDRNQECLLGAFQE